MDIEKLDINAVCFGILCNFTPVCGEEKAKEAVALIRSLQTENEKLQAEVERQRRSADNGQHLKAVKKMAEQRLIDANKILYHQAWESGSMEPANEGVALMSEVQAMPTIDPEALPIVRQLREELERVTAERDAAIKELNGVSSLVDDLAEFVDREIHPVVDYNLYLDLRENVDAVSMFQHEDEWRGLHKEE